MMASPSAPADSAETTLTNEQNVRLTVNGRKYALDLDPRTTLLDALREHLALTGTKKGCDQGQCGACTVIVNGQRINSCLALAAMHDGDEVTTIQGLAEGWRSASDAGCISCTMTDFNAGTALPGQICSAVALLAEHKAGWPKPCDRGCRDRASPHRCRDCPSG